MTASDSAGRNLISLALAAGAIAVLQLSVTISLAALIFAGPLDAGLPTAAGAFILSSAIASIVLGLRSSFNGVISGAQDTAGVVVATVVGSSTVALSGDVRTMTALAIVAVSTIIVGVVLWLLGQFQLGSLVRYIPQPVVGGFIAGTGWLLFRGGVEVMANRPVTLGTLPDIFRWNEFQFVLPGLVLSAIILLVVARSYNPISISLAVVLSAAAFYLSVAAFSSVDAAESGGWLIGPFSSSAQWSPFTPADLTLVDWGTVAAQAPAFAVISLISVVGVLLNLTALEAVAGEDLDFDRELKLTGGVNLVGGFIGGLAAWHRIGGTVLAHHLNMKNRVAPVVVGAIGLFLMVAGSSVLEAIPRSVVGGVLSGLGLSLLWGWAIDYEIGSSIADRHLGLGILVAIAAFGPLIGVGLGIVVAVGLFVVQYSRINPVRHSLSGTTIRSTVDRAPHVQTVLDSKASSTRIIILDGYLFFGSATRAVQSIRHESLSAEPGLYRSLIVDLERVIGVDGSAASALAASISRLASDGVSVTVSCANKTVLHALKSRVLNGDVGWTENLDQAVELNEDRLLDEIQLPEALSFIDTLSQTLGGRAEDLLDYCTRMDLERGEFLICAGVSADSLYFIEEGELLVAAPESNGARRRLRKTGAGAVLGEIGFATGGTRTADVIAEGPVVAHELTRSDLDLLRADHPELAAEFQSFLTRLVASQLRAKIEAMDELLR